MVVDAKKSAGQGFASRVSACASGVFLNSFKTLLHGACQRDGIPHPAPQYHYPFPSGLPMQHSTMPEAIVEGSLVNGIDPAGFWDVPVPLPETSQEFGAAAPTPGLAMFVAALAAVQIQWQPCRRSTPPSVRSSIMGLRGRRRGVTAG